MEIFEYEITKHSVKEFAQLHIYCSESGECSLENIPDFQIRHLADILNEQGGRGWELVQISFGQDGLVIFWKRKIRE